VLRGKAMNLIAERVKVTDDSGNTVDIAAALNAPLEPAEAAEGVEGAEDESEVMAATETDADADADTDTVPDDEAEAETADTKA
jgi:hypothetical protein